MSVDKYHEALRLIQDAGGGNFEGGKPETLIVAAETTLGLAFPPSYRLFLAEMGSGDIGGLEVYGLIDANFESSAVPDGVWITLKKRRDLHLDPAHVIVGDGGDGSLLALATDHLQPDREAPIVRLSVDGKYIEKVADSFGDYLLQEVRWRVGQL